MLITDEKQLETILVKDVKTVSCFVEYLREKGYASVSRNTIFYNLKNKDTLDYIDFCGSPVILMNDKAKNYKPNDYMLTK